MFDFFYLKLIRLLSAARSAFASGDLDKIGDVAQQLGELIGLEAVGAAVNGVLDGVAAKDWQATANAFAALLTALAPFLPANGDVMAANAPATTGDVDAELSALEGDLAVPVTADANAAAFPWAVVVPIVLEAVKALVQLIRERRKAG